MGKVYDGLRTKAQCACGDLELPNIMSRLQGECYADQQ